MRVPMPEIWQWYIFYATGCRVSEVVSVDTADVDFLNRELVVYGKGGKERTVYLAQVATMYLKTYISDRKDNSKALFVGKRQQEDTEKCDRIAA